jgi:hypothetical protein
MIRQAVPRGTGRPPILKPCAARADEHGCEGQCRWSLRLQRRAAPSRAVFLGRVACPPPSPSGRLPAVATTSDQKQHEIAGIGTVPPTGLESAIVTPRG